MSELIENWKPIAGYEGRYDVSIFGNVRSLTRKFRLVAKQLKLRKHRDGYVSVVMYDGEGNSKSRLVHRLVCLAFNGEAPADRQDVNHMNGIKTDNFFKNLEWSNDKVNQAHAQNVLHVKRGGGSPWLGKFDELHIRSKPVIRVAEDGAEKRYPSVSAAGRDGFSFKHVSAVCLGKRQRHLGFTWRFAKDSE